MLFSNSQLFIPHSVILLSLLKLENIIHREAYSNDLLCLPCRWFLVYYGWTACYHNAAWGSSLITHLTLRQDVKFLLLTSETLPITLDRIKHQSMNIEVSAWENCIVTICNLIRVSQCINIDVIYSPFVRFH